MVGSAASSRANLLQRLAVRGPSSAVVEAEGATLFDKRPPRPDGLFAELYLHEVYVGLAPWDIDALEAAIGRPLPAELADFYAEANGLRLFCGSLSIMGYRRTNARGPGLRLPVSLAYGNTLERASDRADDGRIVFGWYASGEGHDVTLLPAHGGRICVTPRSCFGPHLREWDNLEDFLDQEIERLTTAYEDRQGRCDPWDPLPPPVG